MEYIRLHFDEIGLFLKDNAPDKRNRGLFSLCARQGAFTWW
jgi:hypothetical protein